MADSTFAAFELFDCAAVMLSGLLLSMAPGCGDGRRACISCSAVLMRFRRPCSAILCEVRFDVRFVESDVG